MSTIYTFYRIRKILCQNRCVAEIDIMIFAKYYKLMLIQVSLSMLCCRLQNCLINIYIILIHYQIGSAGISTVCISVIWFQLNKCSVVTASVNGILSCKVLCHILRYVSTTVYCYVHLWDETIVY